jgi:hypothetical protein
MPSDEGCRIMSLRHELEIVTKSHPLLLKAAWNLRKPLSAIRLMGPLLSPSTPTTTSFATRRRVVERGDDVLIDGYPRSANTFACDAFLLAQGCSLIDVSVKACPIKMGNHMHAPAQFMLAKKYGVPAMLVLREPTAAALSWLVYTHERDAASAWMHGYQGTGAAQLVLRDYVRFHRPLLTIKDSFVVAPFEEVTTDFGKSVTRLNARFGTRFPAFEHTPEAQEQIFEAMKLRVERRAKQYGLDLSRMYHFPQSQKEELRRRFAAEVEADDLAALRETATALYRELMATL